jgi:hypothetical protein
MRNRDHMRRVLSHQTIIENQQREMQTRVSSTEVAPGIWTDPISQARDDYDGSLAAHEAALMQIKTVHDAASGGSGNIGGAPLDAVWDSALEVAAYIVEGDQALDHLDRIRLSRLIRTMKRVK